MNEDTVYLGERGARVFYLDGRRFFSLVSVLDYLRLQGFTPAEAFQYLSLLPIVDFR